jgi:hypothetical protein
LQDKGVTPQEAYTLQVIQIEQMRKQMEDRDLDLVKEVESFTLNERALKQKLDEKEKHIQYLD